LTKKFFITSDESFNRTCESDRRISWYIDTQIEKSGLEEIPHFKKDENDDVIKDQKQVGIREEETIKTKIKIYLQESLRSFTVSVLPNGKLNLPLSNYFPYTMSSVRAIPKKGFNVEVKLLHENKFIFPKILSNSPIFKGIINKKSSGADMLNIILVQGGRNILYSNLYQSSSFNPNTKNEKKFSYIKSDEKVYNGSTFQFQIHTCPNNDSEYSLFNKSHLAEFYLKELGLDLGLMNTSTYEDLSNHWSHVRKQQKKLENMLSGKNVVDLGNSDFHGDCQFFKNQFMFREKKNMMELLSFKGKYRRCQ
jgi:hypothetical protein